ncbi:hypothetical protein [Nonomuraea gerenzanensis]|uniref:Uncharacterized protein n=1 Tax=Nonomuraea gerenzanensis TaxID=93944 RepID=A0A1M4EJ13_9ACTN|nr:hypothetical protein [Nonomuraea gerenzanensis]UBU10484.1 hypothetical protein LCN96_40040 [Nonomuraea gerenzanensis]SBO98885.1 hypothetical protein BN4615_P8401 [Nonomuraea gerenzanensis]
MLDLEEKYLDLEARVEALEGAAVKAGVTAVDNRLDQIESLLVRIDAKLSDDRST